MTTDYTNWTKDDLIAEITALRNTINVRVKETSDKLTQDWKDLKAEMEKDFDERLRKTRKAYRDFNRQTIEAKVKQVEEMARSQTHLTFMGSLRTMWKGRDVTDLMEQMPFNISYHYSALVEEMKKPLRLQH